MALEYGTFDCNLYAPNSCVPPSGQDTCTKYGAAGYNLLNSYANFYSMTTELMGAIQQAENTVEPDEIVGNFSISNQQPAQLDAKQFFQAVLGFLGGFGGAIGSWASDVNTVESLAAIHSRSKQGDFQPLIKGGPPVARAAPSAKSKPSSGTNAAPANSGSPATARSDPGKFLNITTLPGQLKAYANTAVNVINGIKGALPDNPNTTVPSLNSFLSNMVNTSLSGLEAFSEALFKNGEFYFPAGQSWNLELPDGQIIPEPSMMFEDLMTNGSMLILFDPSLTGINGLVNQLAKTMTSQMIQYVWQNGDASAGVVPFVT
jgi:hypothetical protein